MNREPSLDASFLIPTFNSEQYIQRCLESILKQTHSKKKYEVLVLDGGSIDKTIDIVFGFERKMNLRIIHNELRDAESAKTKGMKLSRGEVIILLDSDNEIVHREWLSLGVMIMGKHPELWGIHSPWSFNRDDISLNKYFSLLGNSDPLAKLLGSTPELEKDCKRYKIVRMRKGTPIIGANGFFWRRSILDQELKKFEKFEEVNFVSHIIAEGMQMYAILSEDFGVRHYYCNSVYGYFMKRFKVANKFIHRKKKHQITWVDREGKMKLLFAFFYCVTIIGPLIESLIRSFSSKKIQWFFHPLISFITAIIYFYSATKILRK